MQFVSSIFSKNYNLRGSLKCSFLKDTKKKIELSSTWKQTNSSVLGIFL